MASDAPDYPAAAPAQRPLWQRILRWIGIALLAIVVLLLVVVFGIDTGPGHRLLADQIGNYNTASGLNIKVGRIDGSIYGRMSLRDLRVSDPKGVFATSPELDVDWRPFGFIRNHVDVRDLTAGLVTLQRNPQLKPTPPSPPGTPTLPNLDIDVNHLRVDRLVLEAPVAGARHIARIEGSAHIADRRAQLLVDGRALIAPGVAGGDTLHLVLDAVPDDDKLNINVKLNAPAGGVVTGLASLTKPLSLSVDGSGSWKAWNGKLMSTLGGGSLADLTLQARNGTFDVTGLTHPGLYLAGPVERLTAPGLSVNIHTALQDRKADSRFSFKSDALAVAGNGLIDLATSRFSNFKVGADLLTPGAVASNLKGRNLHAELALNGAFRTPTVDYKILADQLLFGTMGVDGVYAEGRATVDSNRILLPVNARARRITGLNAAAGGLVTNVAIQGDVAINGATILSDNLHLRSDKIDATAIIAADMKTGRYTGALKGRINDYLVNGFGVINLQTDAHLVTAPAGGFGITGRVAAQTVKITNTGAKTFLGGNAVVSTDIGYLPSGVITFRNLHLSAPQFRVTQGQGQYDTKGGILVSADAYSTQYGPLTARVTGTATDPVVVLHAARPGVGVGLVNLDARVVGRGGAYQVNATGGTTYGPFTADVLVRPSPTLSADIHRIVFAGITANGHVAATNAGPFAGRLAFVGSGLTGNVLMGAQGKYQRADVAARAYQAHVPGPTGFTLGRAIVNASFVNYPKAPQIVADAQVADLHYGPTVVQTGRIKVNHVGGHGTAQALLNGANSGAAFRLAANAQLSPTDYLVALQGLANNINFRTGNPARIHVAGGQYRLLPTQIVFDHGAARVAGSYGHGLTAQLRLDTLDLAAANALIPNLGVGGTATGSLDFTQATPTAFPTGNARVTVTNFTRTGLAATSEPVDIVFAGDLSQAGAQARALVKRNGTPVGRLVANLQPIPGGGSWSSRLLAAPLSGGIRYNGPAGVLFSLAALPQQQLAGAIAIAADFGGRVLAPQLNGLIRADNLTYDNETYGTRLSALRIGARFNNDRLTLDTLTAKAGDGTIQAQGTVGLAAAQGFPIDLTATLSKAQLAKSDSLGATASGQIHVTKNLSGGLIQGTINVENARYAIIRQGTAEVPELTGVHRKSDIGKTAATGPAPAPAGVFKLDLHLVAPSQVFVSGMGLDSEWKLDMHVGGMSSDPQVTGRLEVVRGTYSFNGKKFELNRGIVTFHGGALADPDIDIQATVATTDITVILNITGTGLHPQIAFTSTPTLPQDEVLSRLLFGTSPGNLSAIQAIELASALNGLRGSSGGGLNPLGKLRSATGLDKLTLVSADATTGQKQGLAAGKYITRNIYVEIVTDARGYTATQLTIALTKALSLLSAAGSQGGSNAAVKYQKTY
ncbi:translocation/assembly module TamB domain-containing protein [uncultured Sphingomonas sp.]|uniref:translocation/assembly module TamB domain-containing protein n=1 Tax=uncultured Sphingomonas sp. TaxID=158754 RepID=UPI0035CAEC09